MSISFSVGSVGVHVTIFWPVFGVLLLLVGFVVWKLAHSLYSLFS